MSSARSLLLPAEVYGFCALQRSRRLALAVMFLSVGLAGGLVAWAQLQPVDSVRVSPPLHMDMRTLPPARQLASPLPPPVRDKEDILTPLLAQQSPHSVVLPPAMPEAPPMPSAKALPQEDAVRKEKARPREKTQPPVRKPRPATGATAAAAKADTPASPTAASPATPGGGGPAANAEATAQVAQRDMATALAVLMQAVERHKSYPRQARRTGAQGVVQLMVEVGRDGRVLAWEVRQGSGHGVLDSATRQLGEKLAGLDTGVKGRELRVVVPVKYSLS